MGCWWWWFWWWCAQTCPQLPPFGHGLQTKHYTGRGQQNNNNNNHNNNNNINNNITDNSNSNSNSNITTTATTSQLRLHDYEGTSARRAWAAFEPTFRDPPPSPLNTVPMTVSCILPTGHVSGGCLTYAKKSYPPWRANHFEPCVTGELCSLISSEPSVIGAPFLGLSLLFWGGGAQPPPPHLNFFFIRLRRCFPSRGKRKEKPTCNRSGDSVGVLPLNFVLSVDQ